jgi:hypothetical protein
MVASARSGELSAIRTQRSSVSSVISPSDTSVKQDLLQSSSGFAVAEVNDRTDALVGGTNPLYESEWVAVLDDRHPEYTRIPQGRRRGDPRLVQIDV